MKIKLVGCKQQILPTLKNGVLIKRDEIIDVDDVAGASLLEQDGKYIKVEDKGDDE